MKKLLLLIVPFLLLAPQAHAAARFWVGGSGTWDNTSTTNWSATTGGASGASAPTNVDSATFNGSSGTSFTVTLGANVNPQTVNFTGISGSITLAPAGFSITSNSFGHNTGTLNYSTVVINTASYTSNATASGVATASTLNIDPVYSTSPPGQAIYEDDSMSMGTVNITGNTKVFNGFPTVAFSVSSGKTVSFFQTLHLSSSSFTANGATLNSQTNGTKWIVTSSVAVSVTGATIRDSSASGATFTDTDGADWGNNTGWTFITATGVHAFFSLPAGFFSLMGGNFLLL